MAVVSYHLRSQDGGSLFQITTGKVSEVELGARSPGLETLSLVGLDPFTGGLPIFVPMNKFSILGRGPEELSVSRDRIVFLLPQDIPADSAYIDRLVALKGMGFGIAFECADDPYGAAPLLTLADYFMVDISKNHQSSLLAGLRANFPSMEFIAAGIGTKAEFDHYAKDAFSLFEGRFYTQPVTRGLTSITPLPANAARLRDMANDEDFDLSAAAGLIARDASLSISLLRLVNSSAHAARAGSIEQATEMLGRAELRRWAAAMAAPVTGASGHSEIAKLALVRARMAENLAPLFKLGAQAPGLYMAGLLSVVDMILEMPMERALREVPAAQNIQDALVDKKGELYDVLALIYAYETADWPGVAFILIKYDIGAGALYDAFIETLFWYSDLMAAGKTPAQTAPES